MIATASKGEGWGSGCECGDVGSGGVERGAWAKVDDRHSLPSRQVFTLARRRDWILLSLFIFIIAPALYASCTIDEGCTPDPHHCPVEYWQGSSITALFSDGSEIYRARMTCSLTGEVIYCDREVSCGPETCEAANYPNALSCDTDGLGLGDAPVVEVITFVSEHRDGRDVRKSFARRAAR
jgi:hypothetical protein